MAGVRGGPDEPPDYSVARYMVESNWPQPDDSDVERRPEPHDRPDARAQWDEVKGEWVVWDERDHRWEEVDEHGETGTPDP